MDSNLPFHMLVFIFQIDIPLSYGIFDVSQNIHNLNACEFDWDPTKEVGVYIKVRKRNEFKGLGVGFGDRFCRTV